MVEQLEKLDIDFEIFAAIDGKSGDFLKQIKNIPRREYHVPWTDGPRELLNTEIACALSHQNVYQQILNQKIPYSLILEDDVIVGKKLKYFLQNFDKFEQFLGDIELLNLLSDTPGKIILPKIFKNYFLFDFNRVPNRTSAYVLTYSGAKKMIDHFLPIRMPADDLLGSFEITSIHGLGIYPHIVRLARMPSTINDTDKIAMKVSRTDIRNKVFKIRGFKKM